MVGPDIATCHHRMSPRFDHFYLDSWGILYIKGRLQPNFYFSFCLSWCGNSAGWSPQYSYPFQVQLSALEFSPPFWVFRVFFFMVRAFSLWDVSRRIRLTRPSRVWRWRLLHFQSRMLNSSENSISFSSLGPMVEWIALLRVRWPSMSKIFERVFDFWFRSSSEIFWIITVFARLSWHQTRSGWLLALPCCVGCC